MLTPPHRIIPDSEECLIVLFDLRDPSAVEGLHRGRSIWQGDSDIEALDEDHFILVIRPGAALELLK